MVPVKTNSNWVPSIFNDFFENTSVAAGTIICLLLFATICILSSAFALKDYKAKQVKKVAGISVSMEKWTTDGKTVRDVLEKSEFDFSAF
ncbi:hypothetical protein, partial [Enterococcus faecium]|uniref:hypothetical protein n=1 Tax=Enterococcus faecium TaxID=1352 RepID=UPI000B099DDE